MHNSVTAAPLPEENITDPLRGWTDDVHLKSNPLYSLFWAYIFQVDAQLLH